MDSFEEDPPNGVLIHSEEQATYIIRLSSTNNKKTTATFNLELLPDQTHNLNDVSGRMNLFVDNSSDPHGYYARSANTILSTINNIPASVTGKSLLSKIDNIKAFTYLRTVLQDWDKSYSQWNNILNLTYDVAKALRGNNWEEPETFGEVQNVLTTDEISDTIFTAITSNANWASDLLNVVEIMQNAYYVINTNITNPNAPST